MTLCGPWLPQPQVGSIRGSEADTPVEQHELIPRNCEPAFKQQHSFAHGEESLTTTPMPTVFQEKSMPLVIRRRSMRCIP
jgi:hypothetical protein